MNISIHTTITNSINEKKMGHFALLSGMSGVSLYFSVLGDIDILPDINRRKISIIKKSIKYIEENNVTYTFCNGIAGICWLIESFRRQKKLDIEKSALDDIDSLLMNVALNKLENNEWDYLHGSMGINMYLIERNNTITKEFLFKWLKTIENISIPTKNGVTWLNYNDNEKVNVQNFGLSHGVPSIIVMLCECVEHHIEIGKTNDLIQKAINNLLSYRNCNMESKSQFPIWVLENKVIDYSSRLGWCYGDLGVAISIVHAGISCLNAEWINIGVDIAIKTLHRVFEDTHDINDAGFCHGYFGTAYIYQKFYYLTSELKFKEAADYLFEAGFNFIKIEENQMNKKVYKYKQEYIECNDLISGLSGIGLTILGRENRKYTEWDKIFLLFPTI